MNPPQSDADIRAMLVPIDPPPGGLTRFRARRRRRPTWPWVLGCALATTAALLLALRITPPPVAQPQRTPVDLIAGLDASTLHPRWIGLGRVALPAEPMTLTGDLAGALAARRIATDDDAVVFYMLESK